MTRAEAEKMASKICQGSILWQEPALIESITAALLRVSEESFNEGVEAVKNCKASGLSIVDEHKTVLTRVWLITDTDFNSLRRPQGDEK